jgi:predicted Zn-dependent protease
MSLRLLKAAESGKMRGIISLFRRKCTAMLKKLLGAVFVAGLLFACATSPTGRSQLIFMPESEVDSMGLQAFADLKKKTPISRDAKANQFVQCVVNAMTREVGGQWEAVVFEDKAVNAFALPGGKIGVYTGLLKLTSNQDQLATVIGHEIAHVLSHHSNERLSQETAVKGGLALTQAIAAPQSALGQAGMAVLGLGAQYGVLMPYSRLHESEADSLGLDLMAKAGFNPRQSVLLWKKMAQANQGQPPEFLSTHPSHSTRIQDLQKHMYQALQLQEQAHAMGKRPHCAK